MRLALYGVALCVCLAPILSAQDAAKVDPKHYTVVSENDQVRILKVHYGPHEKSVMHSHVPHRRQGAVQLSGRETGKLCPQGRRRTIRRQHYPLAGEHRRRRI